MTLDAVLMQQQKEYRCAGVQEKAEAENRGRGMNSGPSRAERRENPSVSRRAEPTQEEVDEDEL